MQKTRTAITRHSRELTAEFGFNGFTIEQVCERVGISRRTFFNYFPSKIDAVFGHDSDAMPEGIIERFMAARPKAITGISPTLLADLVEMTAERLSFDETDIVNAHGFFTIAHRDPELLQHMVQTGPKKEAEFRELIASREGMDPQDPLLSSLLHILKHTTLQAIEAYVDASGKRPLAEEFLDLMTRIQHIMGQPLRRSND
ncbi:TetR/AcrR family transcriptional regulator [Glutamicibacter sp. JL.03c]|uniref:TetR/AcrR family transcriptional regulator n=1 Tax=Glutamicibacter sp. JL.03c TaxID=2984842 RepID=UPI0021F6AF04|nr:TetR/AcrR family transcriptional regulator [Glutamicibacter sp. JL.03c]UYQ78279.1 TetR/AcrR family transcriptional regulator [Glutamicibacter sp. JL.03c]